MSAINLRPSRPSFARSAKLLTVPTLSCVVGVNASVSTRAQIVATNPSPAAATQTAAQGVAAAVPVRLPVAVQMVALSGQIAPAVAAAQYIGPYTASAPIDFVLSLPLQNQAELSQLAKSLYDPQDPLYGQYLTSQQFDDQFGPTQDDYNSVLAYAQSMGFNVTQTWSSRTLLSVRATQAQIESAFEIKLGQYQDSTGRLFFAPTGNPSIPVALSGILTGISGISDIAVWKPLNHLRKLETKGKARSPLYVKDGGSPNYIGTGYGGGMTPSDLKTAYNLNNNNLSGKGQKLALVELDTYSGKDIQRYEMDNGINTIRTSLGLSAYVPLQNINVGSGYNTVPTKNTLEVVLDINLMIAMAPGLSKIYVYNAANSVSSLITEYQQIANDNFASQCSTSWGVNEGAISTGSASTENTAFTKMMMEGMSIYAASGDNGSSDDTNGLEVDDPAVQPLMCGVGGTLLSVAVPNSNETYSSETTWNDNTGTTGGGISVTSSQRTATSIPSYQVNAAAYAKSNAASAGVASGISTANRNVPDVAMNASVNSGYIMYISVPVVGNTGGAGYYIVGGTSAAAPAWAGFTALVNENRLLNGMSVLGLPNASLYALAPTASNPNGVNNNYTTLFHDITTGSNNTVSGSSLYPAVYGFDCATGLGSFNGNNLLIQLSGALPTTQH